MECLKTRTQKFNLNQEINSLPLVSGTTPWTKTFATVLYLLLLKAGKLDIG